MKAANSSAINKELDLGNNESLTRGLFPQQDGTFLAMTYAESQWFKTERGAVKWLERRGLTRYGDRIKKK